MKKSDHILDTALIGDLFYSAPGTSGAKMRVHNVLTILFGPLYWKHPLSELLALSPAKIISTPKCGRVTGAQIIAALDRATAGSYSAQYSEHPGMTRAQYYTEKLSDLTLTELNECYRHARAHIRRRMQELGLDEGDE